MVVETTGAISHENLRSNCYHQQTHFCSLSIFSLTVLCCCICTIQSVANDHDTVIIIIIIIKSNTQLFTGWMPFLSPNYIFYIPYFPNFSGHFVITAYAQLSHLRDCYKADISPSSDSLLSLPNQHCQSNECRHIHRCK